MSFRVVCEDCEARKVSEKRKEEEVRAGAPDPQGRFPAKLSLWRWRVGYEYPRSKRDSRLAFRLKRVCDKYGLE